MMVKLIFLKHWMTAYALFADFIFLMFPLWPMDAQDPMLMLAYNGVVFAQIASHSVNDTVEDPLMLRKKNLMSIRAFWRWAIGIYTL